jgi:hypothetical protein
MRAVLSGRPRHVSRATALALVFLCISMLAAVGSFVTSAGSSAATVPPVLTIVPAKAHGASPGTFTQTKTLTRINLIHGRNVLVDKRKVTVSVNITHNLISRQIIHIKWSGAHPTGGIDVNPNDAVTGQYQEYPMVILLCHGFAGDKAPLSEQLTPETCWTSTPSERYYSSPADVPFPPWRLDRYATAAGQRDLTVDQPDPLPSDCGLLNGPHFWLPYENAQRKVFPVGQGGCAGMPGEMNLTGGIGLLPSNDTFAVTNPNGQGSTEFDIWTADTDVDLGCSQTVPCAVIAIPIMGISCDPAAKGMPADDRPPAFEEAQAAAQCEQKGAFEAGELPPGGTPNPLGPQQLSVTGSLWWAASNWRNRFVVPLTFAPPPDICNLVNKNNHQIEVAGSELMDQAMEQWQPHFCLDNKLFTLLYLQEGEPEAATQLETGSIESALLTDQPQTGFPEPVIRAPVAATGFAISFLIDNAKAQPITTLRLDPRLLAKLLTMSYPGLLDIADNDPELLHKCPGVPVAGSDKCTNPLTITQDPEFQALNPGLPAYLSSQISASTILLPANGWDEIYALTSYINDNPAARAWLNGKPDPWGMTVNSSYKDIALPVATWPSLSTYEPADWVDGKTGPQPCYEQDPSPVLPLFQAPANDLIASAEDIQFYNALSIANCVGSGTNGQGYHLAADGQQFVGQRFLIGLTSLADASRYALSTASLLTYTKPGTPAKFTSADGMTFTAPTDATLRNGTALLTPDKTTDTWDFPYALYGKNSTKVADAYPGTMLVYADIPSKGLPAADAFDYAQFLGFASSEGQTPGGAVGQLPGGYLPMTAANHLSSEAQYTLTNAYAVLGQKGDVPPIIPVKTSPSPSTTPSKSSSPSPSTSSSSSPSSSSTSPGGGGGTTSGPDVTPSDSSSVPSSSPSGSSTSASATPSPTVGQIALTPVAHFGLVGYVLPVLAGLALLAALAAFGVSRAGRPRGGKWS